MAVLFVLAAFVLISWLVPSSGKSKRLAKAHPDNSVSLPSDINKLFKSAEDKTGK
jgi:hypothetical protein